MPINKFTTLLDLSRQAKIITGETATFDGKIEVGIPFSGYPTGVDTGTTVSLGIIATEEAIFSGDTGTTIFDVSNISSPNYSSVFSAYTATTWTDPTFSAYTSGLTLPITSVSADTQVLGPYWTLTETGYTGDYIIGIQYTGFSVTYSFNNVAQFGTGDTYSGITTGIIENFSAGTLDYKGPLDYLQSVEDATIDGRLYTNKITISNGASASTIGYVLTQTGEDGEAEWLPNSSADTNTYVTGGTLSGADLILEWNNGGTANPIDLSSLSGSTFTGNTSATCISDIYVSKIHSCSPLEINPLDEGDIIIGSNNNFYFDVTNKRLGIGKVPILGNIDIETTYGNFIWRPTISYNTLTISGGTTNQQQFVSLNEKSAFSFIQMGSGFTSNPTIGGPDDSILLSFDANNLNIITKSGGTGEKNIRFYVGSDHTASSDIHIQGTGSTRGYVGFGTENPTSKVDIIGNINIRNGSTTSIYSDLNAAGGSFTVSGSTNLPRLAVAAAPYLSKPLAGGSVGMRCWNDVTFGGYGKVGDMHVYASNEANGLNIINSPGANPGVNPTEDYIRFYAGLQADDGTAHIHIQGSGATKGYVGINTENPSELLDVNGKIKSTQIQITNGATNGYVLTSDSSGNATWQLGGSTFTGGTVTGNTTFSGGISATTISATTIGSSGDCVDDIYVTNIRSCSPLNINPLNEGSVYFGSTSGVTIDVLNKRFGINTNNPSVELDNRGNTFLSGSGTNTLTVVGSGSSATEPIVTISGSSGELFTIKDSLVDSLFSVNDISGIPTLEVFDNNTVLMGSYSAPAMYTTVKFQPITGLTNLYSIDMSGYTGAWFDYTVLNPTTGGARSGQIMAIFSGNTVNYVETTTISIGSTSAITFSLSANSVDCILQVSATTFDWGVKTIIRSI